jgi:hypothetical protein
MIADSLGSAMLGQLPPVDGKDDVVADPDGIGH